MQSGESGQLMARAKRSIGVVHDFLYCYAGAERVLEQILRVYPEAEIFSLFDFLPPGQRDFIQNKPVRSSFLQKLPLARRKHRAYLPLMPLAIEQMDMSKYDIVISSSYLAAKGVITRPDQMHVCYCHTPVRFAWDQQFQYLAQSRLQKGLRSLFARWILHYIRSWDVRSANGVDHFISNSQYVSRRINKIYRRDSTPIYPPVDVENFTLSMQKDNYYLTASRLVPYKRIDLIVEAFNRFPDRKLVVIGDGPDFRKIQAMAGPNVTLLGHQSFEILKSYMQKAKAFVFAAEEDFGIVPVEAQACGTPVIAFSRGGQAESIISGRTGLFFEQQEVESLLQAILRFEANEGRFNPLAIRANAERFSAGRFREEFETFVESRWAEFQAANNIAPAIDTPPLRFVPGDIDAAPSDATLWSKDVFVPAKDAVSAD
jgi:glycosyltransferase involved in cell wall biosynthesis